MSIVVLKSHFVVSSSSFLSFSTQNSTQFHQLFSVSISSDSFNLFRQFIELYLLLISPNTESIHYLWRMIFSFDVYIEVDGNDWPGIYLTFFRFIFHHQPRFDEETPFFHVFEKVVRWWKIVFRCPLASTRIAHNFLAFELFPSLSNVQIRVQCDGNFYKTLLGLRRRCFVKGKGFSAILGIFRRESRLEMNLAEEGLHL